VPRPERDDDDTMIDKLTTPAALSALVKIGVPAVIALGLVWFLAYRVQTWQDRADTMMQSHQTTTGALLESTRQIGETVKAIEGEHSSASQRLELLLRQVCINGARTEQQRGNCFFPQTR